MRNRLRAVWLVMAAAAAITGVPAAVMLRAGQTPGAQSAASQRRRENAANWLDRDPELKCYMPGVPRAMYLPYPFQIIQSTNKIMVAFEFANAQRTIHLDQVDPYPSDAYMGHSVGHWEGDTLV